MPKTPDRKPSNLVGKAALWLLKAVAQAIASEIIDRIIELFSGSGSS